ncbi:MAG: phosphatidate cytidylyltransferase [Gemmatimonadetes bacterium]|nr:phosphatidate cytidylyltransferase [Gemmatimonadota bacterium]
MTQLQKRWLVAIVGIPTVLGLTYMGGWFIAVPLAGFAGLGAHELFRMAAHRNVYALKVIGCPAAISLVLLAGWRTSYSTFAPWALGLLAGVLMVSLVSALVLRGCDRSPLADVAVTVFGAVYIGLSLAFFPLLHALPAARGWDMGASPAAAGLLAVMLPLAATWIGDSAALFAGTAWGKKKLAPSISPNKSWVGFWAALIGAAIAALGWNAVVRSFVPGLSANVFVILGAGVLLGIAAVVGDLVESLLKREAGVKDSGVFFPGHGGVLDRLDSLIFTVPTAYLVLAVFGSAG